MDTCACCKKTYEGGWLSNCERCGHKFLLDEGEKFYVCDDCILRAVCPHCPDAVLLNFPS